MSYTYEKVADNILKYKTKSGKTKYRVVITINNIAIDKSGFKGITDAKNFIKAKTAEVVTGDYRNKKKMTVSEYWEYYKQRKTTPRGASGKEEWNKSTAYAYINYFEKHILPYFGERKMESITRLEFEEFANQLVDDKGLRTVTADHIFKMLKTMIEDAVNHEELSVNRCKGISAPTSNKKPINKQLTDSEFKALKSYFDKQSILYKVRFYLLTLGLRRSELVGLRVKSIEFVDSDQYIKITVDKSRPPQYQKDGKETKTYDNRVVYGSKEFADVVAEYLDFLKIEFKKRNRTLHKDDWLIVGSRELKPLSSKAVTWYFTNVGKKLGIQFSPHMLRHYYATVAKNNEVDIRMIADVLGHKSLAMTDHYTHGEEESARKIVDSVKFN